jgi:anti-sigma regulatory factor (Ser/Thr protein kinase)
MTTSPRALRTSVLHLILECDFTRVRPAVQEVRSFLKAHGCKEEIRSDFELAVVEGCNNAIKHSCSEQRQQPVELDVTIRRHEIEVRIIDHGPGFAWPNDIQLPEPEHETGRGLYLIRRLMDSACYLRGKKENILVLRRRHCSGHG